VPHVPMRNFMRGAEREDRQATPTSSAGAQLRVPVDGVRLLSAEMDFATRYALLPFVHVTHAHVDWLSAACPSGTFHDPNNNLPALRVLLVSSTANL